MPTLADKSIDLIIVDPPYNIGKAEWDKIPNYIEWCGKWIMECQRILKNNGSFYFFHNDMPQVARLMNWIEDNTRLIFNGLIIWDKGDFRAVAWKNPSEHNKLRSWFPTCEYILFYTFQDETGLTTVKLDMNNFSTLRQYFKDYQGALGLTKLEILEKIGQQADHCFRWGSSQWDMPTPETYSELGKLPIHNEFVRREYEDLRREYEDLRYTFNLQGENKNIVMSNRKNNGNNHPTQKPTDLLENIIRHSSNEKDIVLDCFMGSGSTGVACVNTNRDFIGIEKDGGYFKIAEKRITEAQQQLRMNI